MAMRKFEGAILATEQTWLAMELLRDEDGYLELAVVRYQLDLSAGNVSAPLDTANGVPVMWRHAMGKCDFAVGRVERMSVGGGRLYGDLSIDGGLLAECLPGGLDVLDGGMNRGLSIGFKTMRVTSFERRDGTQEDPHRATLAPEVREVSLTPTPMLAGAGIVYNESEGTLGGDHGPRDDST